MGDRGSITVVGEQCKHGEQPTLFRHWGGSPKAMLDLVDRLQESLPDKGNATPYTRRDPDAVMALLVRLAVDHDGYSAYLGLTPDDGDNSDNGHYVLDLRDMLLLHNGAVVRRG